MGLTNAEKQAAWRARQAANKARVAELEAEVVRLRAQLAELKADPVIALLTYDGPQPDAAIMAAAADAMEDLPPLPGLNATSAEKKAWGKAWWAARQQQKAQQAAAAKQAKANHLRRLKQAMADAHPDKGGDAESFRKARAAYLKAKG
jgi:hypothetical protein